MNPYDPPNEINLTRPPLGINRRVGVLLLFGVLNTLVSCWLIASWLPGNSSHAPLVAIYLAGCVVIFLGETRKVIRDRFS